MLFCIFQLFYTYSFGLILGSDLRNFCFRQRKGYCSVRTCSKDKLKNVICLDILGLNVFYFFILQLLYSSYPSVFAILYAVCAVFSNEESVTVLCFSCRCGQCCRSTTFNICSSPKTKEGKR